jgi:hypothetical protein
MFSKVLRQRLSHSESSGTTGAFVLSIHVGKIQQAHNRGTGRLYIIEKTQSMFFSFAFVLWLFDWR